MTYRAPKKRSHRRIGRNKAKPRREAGYAPEQEMGRWSGYYVAKFGGLLAIAFGGTLLVAGYFSDASKTSLFIHTAIAISMISAGILAIGTKKKLYMNSRYIIIRKWVLSRLVSEETIPISSCYQIFIYVNAVTSWGADSLTASGSSDMYFIEILRGAGEKAVSLSDFCSAGARTPRYLAKVRAFARSAAEQTGLPVIQSTSVRADVAKWLKDSKKRNLWQPERNY